MAPEQADGRNRPIGPAADVYALGSMLYELLTGRPAFRGPSPLETLLLVVGEEPVPPRSSQPRIPRDLEAICLRCLAKQPAERYASAAALAEDLSRFRRGEPVQARPLGPWGRLLRWAQKRPALAATLAALLVFYFDHLVLVSLDLAEGGAFHWFVTGLLVVWAGGAILFHNLASRPRMRLPATYAWSAMDVVLFTILLLRADGPKSALVVAYLLLIAGSALRFRIPLVVFVTMLSLASYALLSLDAVYRRPEDELIIPLPNAIIFCLSMALMGVIVSVLLRRFKLALAQER
jgi:serine/threonine-protein kinase